MLSKLFRKLKYKLDCILNKSDEKKKRESLRKEILLYYTENKSQDEEIETVVEYLRHNKIINKLIPGSARKITYLGGIKLGMDSVCGFPYVVHEGKRLYLLKKPTNKALKYYYLSLLEEQSTGSPHLYVTPDFEVSEGDVLFDIGSAEGIFALSNIEKASHLVLFEADANWLKALQTTFEPWKDKVTIIPKYVSDIDDEHHITIDTFIRQYGEHLSPDFVKMDVEGAEIKVLNGMKSCISRKKLKLAVTTYHYQNDYQEISSFLADYNFTQEPSQGITLVGLDECKPPYFRRALIRASKA